MSNAILGEIPHIDRLERLSPVCKGRHTPCALTLACCGREGSPYVTCPSPPKESRLVERERHRDATMCTCQRLAVS